MNEPLTDRQTLNPAAIEPAAADPATLELRDIHLPEPISWWPIAPGWWILLASIILIIAGIFFARRFYQNRQLKRDIRTELDAIKQQYAETKDKAQLAKELSILLRRASISYYPKTDFAGLTGNRWLSHLDETHQSTSTDKKFCSKTGEILLTAPYLPTEATPDFDDVSLIQLCESWLLSDHRKHTSHAFYGGRRA